MKNIQTDSRKIQQGDIFLAISCEAAEKNIANALQNGAEIIFAGKELEDKISTDKVFFVEDIRLLASKLAKFEYQNQPKHCVSITGTNGKSSISHFIHQICFLNGKKSANLGTLGLFIGSEKVENCGFEIPNLTTPGPFELHKILNYLYDQNVENLVFEASSHALDQKRLHSVHLSAAAFSNLASDHLDYHKTKEEYLAAKLKLFSEILPKDKPATVFGDSEIVLNAVRAVHQNIVTFGFSNENDIFAENVKEFGDRAIFDCSIFGKKFNNITLNLFGTFQIQNILCAIGVLVSIGFDPAQIVETLPNIKPLNGRMEFITSFNGGYIYIDFAHTSEAFRNALQNFKKACKGRLICVFGCGGDRDKSKRGEMGKTAYETADIVIITDDNPRTEDPSQIRQEIISNCRNAIEIADRRSAIQHAINLIEPNDFLIILGKGHETTQIYKDKILHFSDKEEVLSFTN